MRSLIILEVEHGEDTDVLNDILGTTTAHVDVHYYSRAVVKDYTVRVDLPECFVLDTPAPEVCDNCGAVEGTDAYDNFHDSQNCWSN